MMGREGILGEDCYVDFTNPDFKMLAEAMCGPNAWTLF